MVSSIWAACGIIPPESNCQSAHIWEHFAVELHRREASLMAHEDSYERTRSDMVVDLPGPTGSLPE
jgi:hypothetical protein